MVQPVENDAMGDLIGHIPHHSTTATKPTIQCCCGRQDCAYLEHNSSAVEELERELHTAATLGQALLVRHEAYMHDAERDRMEMNGKIDQLEQEKKRLEEESARSAEENQQLSAQLDGLSTTLADSEIHIKSLESTLQSTRQELRRLEILASRTQDLEIQLAAVEQEQDILQKTVAKSEAEERSAIQRWKNAERRLHELQDQLERIENEAREERERHVEVIGRMERQRAVENELGSAAGRLKAAAATTGATKNGSNVVSHFVKDILQDNANLQLGIMELREMLINSNDEVQALREQLLLHQPLDNTEAEGGEKTPTLGAELASKSQPTSLAPPPELHIHHHYHVPKKEDKRPKKKRLSLSASIFTPPRSGQSPISPRTPRSRDTASTILAQTSVTIPGPRTPTNRWSMQSALSDFAPSSVPSSPQSAYRSSTLFDRNFDIDSSRPTSPGSSIDPLSPQFAPKRHRKKISEVSTRSFGGTNFQPHHVIHEEDDDVPAITNLNNASVPSLHLDTSCAQDAQVANYQTPTDDWNETYRPPLRRTSSHESILSVSRIDIHALKSRPSQFTIGSNNLLLLPRTRNSPSSMVSVNTEVTAHPTISRFGHESTSHLRSNIQGHNSDARSISSGGSAESTNARVGGKLGGWVFGRWGATPTKSAAPVPQRAVSTPQTQEPPFMTRPAGINQKGPIPGLIRKISKAPSKVRSNSVDREALKEILDEVAGLGLG